MNQQINESLDANQWSNEAMNQRVKKSMIQRWVSELASGWINESVRRASERSQKVWRPH